MRVRRLADVRQLGQLAQMQIKLALSSEGTVRTALAHVEQPNESGASPAAIRKKKKLQKFRLKRKSRVMTTSDGLTFCPYPSPDPSVALHVALLREFGSWWDGGELADEMIIPGHQVRFRYDFCFPRYRLAIEVDGFGYHRDLDSFKKDREKQKHALKHGWVVHRLTNSDLRNAFNTIIPDIKTILGHREKRDAELAPTGKTWCSLVL